MNPDANAPEGRNGPAGRPRVLAVLAMLGFFYCSMGCITAWSTIIALTGSHDTFSHAVRDDASRLTSLPKQLGTPDQLKQVAERKAEAMWSRRGVFVPLAIANAVLTSLMLLAIAAAMSRRLAWGRSAWQFAALISLVSVAMDGVVNYVHSRDLIQAVADLHDPLSDQLRQLMSASDITLAVRTGLEVVFLLSTASYLSRPAVLRYCDRSV